MKKFVISSIVLALCLLSILYLVYFKGFYINFVDKKVITTQAHVADKKIQIQNENGKYEDFIIKGVDLPSTIAGYYGTDYAIDKETYIKWFKEMQDMGANTIRVYTIYNDTFYNALYEYNHDNKNPLYLLQGIQVSDYANNNRLDAYGKEFFYSLKEDALNVVDVIHGRKIITTNKMKGSGIYRKDVSSWTLGYMIGNEWKASTIEYTNKSDYRNAFQGEYFKTTDASSNFEAILANVMDTLVSYESDKYGTQALITFASSPEIDPFIYEKQYASQIGKYVSIDPEHITPTSKLRSGYFASYKLYDFCPNFANYFSIEQKKKIEDTLKSLDTSLYYEGYSQLLQQYHTMPVVISGFGYSSSRGSDQETLILNEKQQGEAIVKTYEDIIKSGCSGAFIDSWQDCWDKRGWNISYAVDVNEIYRWNDIQSESTGYGLLSFASQERFIDGSDSDWKEREMILDGTTKLNVTSDEKGIYLYIEKEGLRKEDELFIPIDVTPKSGSKVDEKTKVNFDRAADFLLHVNGKDTKIMVHSRYEALRENYLMQSAGQDPFVDIPKLNAPTFMPITMLCEQKNMIEETMSDEEKFKLSLYKTFETGLLREGKSDQAQENYDSLSDYAYGENSLEIRIPWQLLNFYNPYDHEVHDDYYAGNYGVEGLSISELYIGVGDGRQQIPMHKMKLQDISSLKFKERLKQSYYIVKERWGETDD